MLTKSFTFDVLREAVRECSSYDFKQVTDDDGDTAYALIDPFGDIDGDFFYDLADVEDYIINNSQVEEYLNNYAKEAA